MRALSTETQDAWRCMLLFHSDADSQHCACVLCTMAHRSQKACRHQATTHALAKYMMALIVWRKARSQALEVNAELRNHRWVLAKQQAGRRYRHLHGKLTRGPAHDAAVAATASSKLSLHVFFLA